MSTRTRVLFTVERSRYQAIEEVPARKILKYHKDFSFCVKYFLKANDTHMIKSF